MPNAPDIALTLPDGWSRLPNDGPLTVGPESDEGVLQFSSPTSSRRWREHADLEPLLRDFASGSGFGEVVRVSSGVSAYGRFVCAECLSEKFGDACAWLFAPPTNDPLLVTWLADSPGDEDRRAREVVSVMKAGFFSGVVAAVAAQAQRELDAAGALTAAILLVSRSRGELVNLVVAPGDATSTVAAIRGQRALTSADAVAHLSADGLVYVEGKLRRKLFMLRPRQQPTELEANDVAVSNFF